MENKSKEIAEPKTCRVLPNGSRLSSAKNPCGGEIYNLFTLKDSLIEAKKSKALLFSAASKISKGFPLAPLSLEKQRSYTLVFQIFSTKTVASKRASSNSASGFPIFYLPSSPHFASFGKEGVCDGSGWSVGSYIGKKVK